MSASHEDERPSSSVPGGFETLDSFTRFNATITHNISETLDIHLAADNLFDADYEAVAGFPSPGLQFRVSLRQRY